MTLLAPSLAPLPVAERLGLDRIAALPNLVTLARTVAAVAVGGMGVAHGDLRLLAIGYAVYWLGDMADGFLARTLGLTSRLGAVLDIVCDRVSAGLLCAGLLSIHPRVLPVSVVFLLVFMALDVMLSLAFLCWPIDTPNDFGLVDAAVYRWNWSPLAKAVNTAGVVAPASLGSYPLALAVALAVLGVKLWSAHRILGLLQVAP